LEMLKKPMEPLVMEKSTTLEESPPLQAAADELPAKGLVSRIGARLATGVWQVAALPKIAVDVAVHTVVDAKVKTVQTVELTKTAVSETVALLKWTYENPEDAAKCARAEAGIRATDAVTYTKATATCAAIGAKDRTIAAATYAKDSTVAVTVFTKDKSICVATCAVNSSLKAATYTKDTTVCAVNSSLKAATYTKDTTVSVVSSTAKSTLAVATLFAWSIQHPQVAAHDAWEAAIDYKDLAHIKAVETASETKTKTAEAAAVTQEKLAAAATFARTKASEPQVQAVAASAASGAVALGASGGALGLTAGGAIGAACGVVPAIFTFGLSIPIGFAIGSGTGFFVGTAVGGTAGLVGGGAAGYGVYGQKDEIKSGLGSTWTKVNDCADYAKGRVQASASFVRTKLPRSSDTGSTS
jgi:hypothetical protein